ncbi:CpsD/CapB family tyrosine-protein kinase [Fictibacillus barbaricus]|uniref:CpsD/CapB family tyrosine-protein kinase n=1 Tax=Fictibacillus barbaricus TaxID=182136 RepID=A0ABS2ZE98_9BACL|nr:CpsD/CapB family tyrosine-protein kinase [Fictibacillus barbaricus]MBN3546498.1 CpsD/CapB family tyrosine-protein kinase [Fictibacillus barbaricus]GGB41499.1 tyrosine-protein kinase YwqD [Fictibacillus barbaricus]
MLRAKKDPVIKYNRSTEEVRILRSNIEKQMEDSRSQIMMITSPKGSSHHIYISSHLAISFAEQGKKVLLVDADLRNPTLHTYFNLPNTKGFSDVVLQGENVFLHARSDYLKGLYILTAGNLYHTPIDLWVSKKIQHAVNSWKEMFDLVLFHAPSYLEISDAQILVDQCDGVLLVVQKGKTKIEDASAAKQQISRSKKTILGVIYQTG